MGGHWADEVTVGPLGTGEEAVIPVRVRAGDHLAAVVIARTAPRAVVAARHVDELGELTADQLYYLTSDAAKLAAATDCLVDELVVRMRSTSPPASWETIGAALDVHRSTARERYQRIQARRQSAGG